MNEQSLRDLIATAKTATEEVLAEAEAQVAADGYDPDYRAYNLIDDALSNLEAALKLA